MLAKQNGVCVVCRQPETKVINGKVLKLAVDHDHETGKVRGLLCMACNIAIGYLQNDPLRARSVAEYLERCSQE
jgi:hypothetical protein